MLQMQQLSDHLLTGMFLKEKEGTPINDKNQNQLTHKPTPYEKKTTL